MAGEPKLPGEDSITRQVIRLTQVKQTILFSLGIMLTGCKDHEVHKLKHLLLPRNATYWPGRGVVVGYAIVLHTSMLKARQPMLERSWDY